MQSVPRSKCLSELLDPVNKDSINVYPPSWESGAHWLCQIIVAAFFEINTAVSISTNHTLAALHIHNFLHGLMGF